MLNIMQNAVREPTSYATVLDGLTLLDEHLASQELESFVVFNRAYIVVTQTIKEYAARDYFRHPDAVEQFTVAFAERYFQIVREIMASGQSKSEAWNKLQQAQSQPHFIQLLMGANAHINYDLALVMAEGMATKELRRDILSIDRLLLGCGKQIPSLFVELYPVPRFIKQHFQWLYYLPVMTMILSWRLAAWRASKRIKKDGPEAANFQAKSVRIAKRLLRVGSFLKQI